MILQNRTRAHLFLNLGKAITVFILGSIVVHIIVMVLDYYLMIKPLYLNLREDFVSSIFSAPMYPMMVAYGLFSLAIYFLWEKKKKPCFLPVKQKYKTRKSKLSSNLCNT